MTLRRGSALGTRKTRMQEALVAALRARLRTPYGAAQCSPAAEVSFFNSPLVPGRTLVVGMGNPIVSDDSVGVRLATDLKQSLAAIRGVDVVEECAYGGLDLLDLVVGYDRLIVLDAIKTVGGVPGTWYEIAAGDLRETLHLRNVHDVNLATALALGRRLGFHVPNDARIHIFAVEAEDVYTFAETLTPALETAYPEMAREILGRVMVLLRAGSGVVF